MAWPDCGCPLRERDPAVRPVAPPPPTVDDWPPDPDETPDDGREELDPDPPELVLDPLRGDADPDLVADDDGVREPVGV